MAGIEKITGHILGNARLDAEKIFDGGKTRADAVSAKYKAKAEEIMAKRRAESNAEAEALLSRAEASGSNVRRNMLLETKNELLDRAFDLAASVFLRMKPDEYLDFMEKLLETSLTMAAEREKESVAQYSAEFVKSDTAYIRLCSKDRKAIGDRLEAYGQIVAERFGKSFELENTAADIDGGFILRLGDVETNCSIAALIGESRRSLEGGVYKTLFPDGGGVGGGGKNEGANGR